MQLVYLVGTDHRYQRLGSFGVPEEVATEFRHQLKQLVAEYFHSAPKRETLRRRRRD